MKRVHLAGLALLFAVICGLGLRLYGIHFGLPYLYNPDEPRFVNAAAKILGNRDPNPHWFGHPGSTTIYLLSALYSFVFAGGFVLGIFGSGEEFTRLYFQDPTLFYLGGRILFAVFGVGTLVITYRVAERISGRYAAGIASILLALSPLHVKISKLIRTDILMTFLVIVAFSFCLKILQEPGWRNYALAGFFTGLAVATKYPALMVVPSIVMAHLLAVSTPWKRRPFSPLAVAFAAMLSGLFIGSPYLFIDFRTALSDLSSQASARHVGAVGGGLLANLAWYVRVPLWDTLSLTGLSLSLLGFARCAISRQGGKWLLAVFPALFLVSISFLSERWDRWIIPIIPFMCILAGIGLVCLTDWVHRRSGPAIACVVGAIVLCAAGLPLLRVNLAAGREMSRIDTRTLTRQWMLAHVPEGSCVLMEQGTPQFQKDTYRFFLIAENGRPVEVDPGDSRHATFRPPYRLIGDVEGIDAVRAAGIEYMVVGAWYDRYAAASRHQSFARERAQKYEALMRAATKIWSVSPIKGRSRGPKLRVYRFHWHGTDKR